MGKVFGFFGNSCFWGCKRGFLIYSCFLIVDYCLLEIFISACDARGYGFTLRFFGYRGSGIFVEKFGKVCKSWAKVGGLFGKVGQLLKNKWQNSPLFRFLAVFLSDCCVTWLWPILEI